ncbi:hypothetical protein ARALYDRAFT_906862 [Arabidopsis lyrata subsp. lyrata]|uniref:FKB95-like N-terminal Kelch domain-containing protein n=1 Tax=Arabidopsis lyrata subsp. lyrata TaxID=81972 RepID=D7LUV0_ARALL|nr:hypothetical protein ARALYDRAFT_906862 [Arabidopsis lyrata subsp. lyrata]
MPWLHSQFPTLLLPTFRVSWLLVLVSITFAASSSVFVLDCRSHTWSEAPSLREELKSLSASVLNGKIYVAGSCKDGDSNSLKNLFQVFDTETQIWDHVMCPPLAARRNVREVAYNSEESKFDLVGPGGMSDFMFSDSYCEIENVLYSVSKGELKWYDTEVRMWRNLEGLAGLPKFPQGANVRLANYGGKIAVLWQWWHLSKGDLVCQDCA